MTNYPKLLLHYYRRSKDYDAWECRPDVAVFGYQLMKEMGHIDPSEYEKKFQSFKTQYIKERRENGAVSYTISNNMDQYKFFVKLEIYKEHALKWMANNENLALMMEQKIN